MQYLKYLGKQSNSNTANLKHMFSHRKAHVLNNLKSINCVPEKPVKVTRSKSQNKKKPSRTHTLKKGKSNQFMIPAEIKINLDLWRENLNLSGKIFDLAELSLVDPLSMEKSRKWAI